MNGLRRRDARNSRSGPQGLNSGEAAHDLAGTGLTTGKFIQVTSDKISDVLISCVVPAFENVPLLARCLVSIATQQGVKLEIIVVDDSRSDSVRTFVETLAQRFPEILYFAGARTGNPVDNWNAGLERARGRYRVVVHHDEFFFDPNFLAQAVARLNDGGATVHIGQTRLVGNRRASRFALAFAVARHLRPSPWTLYVVNWIGPTASVLYRDQPSLRFDPSLTWLVDVDFYVRLLDQGAVTAWDEGPSIGSYPHGGQISAHVERFATIEREMAWLETAYPTRLRAWQYRLIKLLISLRRALSRALPK